MDEGALRAVNTALRWPYSFSRRGMTKIFREISGDAKRLGSGAPMAAIDKPAPQATSNTSVPCTSPSLKCASRLISNGGYKHATPQLLLLEP